MATPYRADHVGSLLRPPELLQAREQYQQHQLTADEFRQVEDAAVLKALDLQREVGIGVYTEGEYRRTGWSTAIRDAVEGLVPTAGSPIQGFLGQWQGPHGDLATATMTAGTVFLMWIGEQIDEYGIGNGISLLIMAGILARIPRAIQDLYEGFLKDGVKLGGDRGIESLLILGILFIVVIWGVIFITQGQRRIPTQSAKHVRGRRVWGGQKQSLPLRVNQAGVMPIIFASSLLMFPQLILQQIMQTSWSNYWVFQQLSLSFGGERGYVYNVCYIALIYFFCYFWTAITFNPKDMANNLKDYGSFIPGHRPGKRTADYLERVMVRITYVGAAFLALVAVIPTVIQGFLNVDFVIASFFGGTGLLIVVSVGLDLVQKIDSHLVMRNYGGLLES